jgi:hypothetical protein
MFLFELKYLPLGPGNQVNVLFTFDSSNNSSIEHLFDKSINRNKKFLYATLLNTHTLWVDA